MFDTLAVFESVEYLDSLSTLLQTLNHCVQLVTGAYSQKVRVGSRRHMTRTSPLNQECPENPAGLDQDGRYRFPKLV